MKKALLLLVLAMVSGCTSHPAYRKVQLDVDQPATAQAAGRSTAVPLRVAFAPVLSPREALETDTDVADYLGHRLHRSPVLIQGNSYSQVNELVRSGYCDVAFVSSRAFLLGQSEFGMVALAVPQVRGQLHCYSYLIVPADSAANRLEDLRGKVFAFCDPLSAEGYLEVQRQLARHDESPERFFSRTFFTYSNDNSIRAVAEKMADGAAVESLVYEYMARLHPDLVRKTRVIGRSQPYGMPLLVANARMDPVLRNRVQALLLNMDRDPLGRVALRQLNADRFVRPDARFWPGQADTPQNGWEAG